MITWIIIVAIFIIAFLWRVLEKIHEKPVNDKKKLDIETGRYIMEDEFDDL